MDTQKQTNKEEMGAISTKTNPDKSVMKRYTPEEAKKMISEIVMLDGDLSNNLKNLGDEILPKFFYGNEQEKKEATEKLGKKALEVMMALETDTHWALMESFYSQYRGLAKEFSSQLIKDYDCNTIAEKALAEIIANAYIRIIDNSRRLNNQLGDPDGGQPITENRTKYLTMLSKQVDRTNRQFLSALVTLKQLKMPAIEMNIKAKTAFVAQNQQINALNNSAQQNENINPK